MHTRDILQLLHESCKEWGASINNDMERYPWDIKWKEQDAETHTYDPTCF